MFNPAHLVESVSGILQHGRHRQQGECHLKMELCVSVIILDYSKPFGSQNVHYTEIKLV